MQEEEARMAKSLLTSSVLPIRSSKSPKSNRDLPKSKKISNLLQSLKGVFVRMSLLRTAARHRINYCQSRHVAGKQVNSKVKSLASPKAQRSRRLNWRFKRNLNPLKSHLINSQAPQHLEDGSGPGRAHDQRWLLFKLCDEATYSQEKSYILHKLSFTLIYNFKSV